MTPRRSLFSLAALAVTIVLAGCTAGPTDDENVAPSPAIAALTDRLDESSAAITVWQNATDLAALQQAAEQVRNLIVGEVGPYYGDSNSDGTVSGAATTGVLPGLQGEPGLASMVEGDCLEQDVLGGAWSDPAERWQILDDAIATWTPENNTFPLLPSHPQRTIGWATLALSEDDLETAREFASHAQLHIDVSVAALESCG